ncbi:MAG: hypothetical protein ACK5ME_02625 [Parahaliea sp.]
MHTQSGETLTGQLVYSDGAPADGNYIRVQNLSDSAFSTLALKTNKQGNFQLALTPGHRYAITADGDEGHSITVKINTDTDEHRQNEESRQPPIYLIIASLLLLSLIPAYFLRTKKPD